MTVDEAVQRILRGHWLLIVLATLVPMAVAGITVERAPVMYQAVSRLQLGTALASSNVEADAASNRTLGVATSPGIVERALFQAGLRTTVDYAQYATQHIDVQRVGVSPIVEISVTDPEAARAAAINRQLTDAVVAFANGGERDAETTRIERLDASVVSLSKTRDGLINSLSNASPQRVLQLQAQINAIQTTIAEDLRQRSELIVASSTRSSTVLLDAARTPVQPLSSGLLTELVLAALMGLIASIGIAAAWETLAPTLRRSSAISMSLGVPLLGEFRQLSQLPPLNAVGRVAARAALVARGQGVSDVVLVPVRQEHRGSLVRLASALEGYRATAPAERLHYSVWDDIWPGTGGRPGAVFVTPARVRGKELRAMQEIVTFVGWPILGVVTYLPEKRRAARRSKGDDAEPEQGDTSTPGVPKTAWLTAELNGATHKVPSAPDRGMAR